MINSKDNQSNEYVEIQHTHWVDDGNGWMIPFFTTFYLDKLPKDIEFKKDNSK